MDIRKLDYLESNKQSYLKGFSRNTPFKNMIFYNHVKNKLSLVSENSPFNHGNMEGER